MIAMLLFCLDALSYCELASTFKVLTWHVMLDAGDAVTAYRKDPKSAN
jgi:hypothetical protein